MERIGEIVERLLGTRPDVVDHIRTLGQTSVARVVVDGRELFVKEQAPGRAAGEAWCYATASDAGVPVAAIVAQDLDAGVLITERVRGVPLYELDGTLVAIALDELGQYLASLHRVPTDGFGFLVATSPEGVPSIGTFPTQRELVGVQHGADVDYLRNHDVITEPLEGLVRFIDSRIDEVLDRCSPVFLHGDLSTDHIYCDPSTGCITAFIDFSGVGGDPIQDLDWFAIHEPKAVDPIAEAEGLDLDTVHTVLPLYAAMRVLGEIRWCHFHGHTDTVQRLIEDAERLLGGA